MRSPARTSAAGRCAGRRRRDLRGRSRLAKRSAGRSHPDNRRRRASHGSSWASAGCTSGTPHIRAAHIAAIRRIIAAMGDELEPLLSREHGRRRRGRRELDAQRREVADFGSPPGDAAQREGDRQALAAGVHQRAGHGAAELPIVDQSRERRLDADVDLVGGSEQRLFRRARRGPGEEARKSPVPPTTGSSSCPPRDIMRSDGFTDDLQPG